MTIAEFVYDPFSPSFDSDPYPTYHYLREHAPVFFWEVAGVYLISRYRDIDALLQDPRFAMPGQEPDRPAPRTEGGAVQRRLIDNAFFGLDQAGHARLRRLVAPAFAPRAAQQRRDDIRVIVDELIDTFGDRDTADAVGDFARHIPLRVMCHLLAIPAEHRDLFFRFTEGMLATIVPWVGPDDFDRYVAVFPEAVAMLTDLAGKLRVRPGDDLLSQLVQVHDEGDRLSVDELLGVVTSLIAAGIESPVHLISNGIKTLLTRQEVLAAVRADPSVLPTALVEASRLDSFAKHGLSRTALEDVELHGVTLPAGTRLVMLMGSALRDPEAFTDPDRYDMNRPPTRLMFGAGSHFCLGQAMARAEAEVAIGRLLERFPALSAAGQPVFEPNAVRRHMSSLPVRLR